MSGRHDRESIFALLHAEILDGTLAPGTPLREVALAERFEVSRTPVRDALSRLEQAGLLTRAQRGLEVQSVDPQTIMQVYDARILLEEQVAGDAALQRTVSDVLRIEALLERDRALTARDDAALIRANLEFHHAVWTASHNPVLQDLLAQLSRHLVHAPHSTLTVEGRWEQALEEHARLVAAISARDVDAARATARAHFETARAIRLDLLRASAREETTATAAD
ncbi:GntR family transcriptional regulator [Brachybacterium sp. NBEC-018]|uniref:GntR family transcriptional regulator n=1 Tax=Brachybacterium sp. NBEC-018 TaxID=2996004 RepID=UPI002174E1E0|nr:GntR family transcriptional regulator [Brachybacterium sp. NBEC-018]UVY84573.1 GntR family transcriptional regulator [Brachybacterium sp. NBEC-018]